jgi:hypothetical protein
VHYVDSYRLISHLCSPRLWQHFSYLPAYIGKIAIPESMVSAGNEYWNENIKIVSELDNCNCLMKYISAIK